MFKNSGNLSQKCPQNPNFQLAVAMATKILFQKYFRIVSLRERPTNDINLKKIYFFPWPPESPYLQTIPLKLVSDHS